MTLRYYTLVASLPPLPYFESADMLPIGRERLASRLRMLDPDHYADLDRVRRLVGWREQPATRRDAQVAAYYRFALRETRNPFVRDFVVFRIGMRTAVAGLRRRRRGLGPPTGEAATFSSTARRVVANWDLPDFGLGARFPWLEDARRDFERGNASELEGRLLRFVWRHLQRSADAQEPFSFERVFCYVFQWSVLNRRLTYDVDGAARRFRELVSEVTHEHRQLFV